ncbi:MAG: T9SS type A sorting domain-containing protein, partial [Chitinophagales bacterium]
ISTVGFELYQNTPNPWVSKTQIGFHLPEATEARLTIYDAMGGVLYTAKGQFGKGYNAFHLDRKLVESTGSLYYKVETDTDQAVKIMVNG